MRTYFVIAFLSFTLISCSADGSKSTGETTAEPVDSFYCNCTELTFDQPYNHFWRFEKRVGFTGKCEEFYPDGTVKISKNLVEGKLHGKVITYYDNGQVHDEKEFDMNLQTGEQITYTKKGEVKFHALYKRGTQTQVLINKPDMVEEDPWSAN